MKVHNLTINGKEIPNQFIIYDNGKLLFQSYNSIIVLIENGQTFLDKNKWDYSKTTGKYRNVFLNKTKKETEAKIKSGEYILKDLNE